MSCCGEPSAGACLDHGSVAYVLGAGGIGESGQGLLSGCGCRGAAGDHECQRGASQTVHQQLGQLGVTVGDMSGAAFRQGADHLSEPGRLWQEMALHLSVKLGHGKVAMIKHGRNELMPFSALIDTHSSAPTLCRPDQWSRANVL